MSRRLAAGGVASTHVVEPLADTSVRDLTPLAELTFLEDLWLSGKAVADLGPLVALAKLQRVDLERTTVADDQIVQLQDALPTVLVSRS